MGEGNIGLPDGRWWRFLYCTLINVISLVVCLIGAGMFAKTSVMVLGVVCVSLLSVIISFCIQSPMEVNAGCMISTFVVTEQLEHEASEHCRTST